jgi:hypothetical protein
MSKVDTKHPKYTEMTDQWQKCRDTVSGQKAVHAGGERYLPKLKDQSIEDYNAYRLRASFFNATWRTIDALKGLMFRKPPIVDIPASVESLLDDVTLSGTSFQVFAQLTAIEILTSGRMGILVDYPQQSTEGMTIADAQLMQVRPTMQMYPAESIINWKTARVGNATVVSLVVLAESATLESGEFEHKTEARYRVLDLFDGRYRVRVFRVSEGKEDEQIGNDIFPMMNGAKMDSIPFYFIGVDSTSSDVDEPPLIDLIDLNLDHYRMGADYKHGLHFTGLPTAVISGYVPENPGDKLYIGSASAWCFPDPQASASFLEFTGQGLGALERGLEKSEQQMAILGARLLTSEKRDAETAQTAQIHRAGENSILSSISQTISIGLTNALNTFCEWVGSPGEWSIELNREFTPAGLDAPALTALVGAWQSGAISFQTLFENLQRAEIIESELTFEEAQAQIGSTPPPKPEAPQV